LSRSRWGLDRHRVRALLKCLRDGLLTPQQEEWVMAEIRLKSRILEIGYAKRDKRSHASYYRLLQHCALPPATESDFTQLGEKDQRV
jgi:hypothetical protein